jgi:uncharacterized phage-associated protein
MFRNQLNDKIGNLLNYLSTKSPNLSLTKLLKLIYLIDETSYSRTGSPITWFDYKVWKMGPVAEELYNELKFDQSLVQNGVKINLEKFIKTEYTFISGYSQLTILPVGDYNLDDFSPFEVALMDNIIEKFSSCSAAQLVDILHTQGTLWHQSVNENKLDLNFAVYGNKSNHTIDFSQLIKENPILQLAAKSAYESMQLKETTDELI